MGDDSAVMQELSRAFVVCFFFCPPSKSDARSKVIRAITSSGVEKKKERKKERETTKTSRLVCQLICGAHTGNKCALSRVPVVSRRVMCYCCVSSRWQPELVHKVARQAPPSGPEQKGGDKLRNNGGRKATSKRDSSKLATGCGSKKVPVRRR